MPQFVYQARRGSKNLKGTLTAMDKSAAVEELRKQGLMVLSLKPQQNQLLSTEIYIGNPVKPAHFIMFLRQLATLIRAGVSIVEAVNILAEQSESKPLRKTLHEVSGSLVRGLTFSHAVQEHKRIFPPMFVNMVRAGEETGDLEGTLDRLARFFEKEHVTREKIKSAMTYPLVVGFLAIAAVVYLLKAVVPQFVSMFESMNAELPLVTRMVLAVSSSIENQWWYWVLGVLGLVVAFITARRTEKGAYALDYVQLKVPVFGKLKQKGSIALMTRTLSSLYSSSVPILQSLHIVESVVGNKVIGGFIRDSADSLQQGRPLSEPLKKAWAFPPMVTQMIAIGEETGALDQMLEKIADFYEMEVENTVDRLKSLIEPLLLVFLAGVVGTIVAAIMLPMFSLYSNIG
ncbi:type II secretion system protein [Paenibacillus mucilaginosus 3016]|uniref:Type II secretion system protein n=2 Tax=Paenibacillus mucilaginosus TaxID=61624 RepID=H6NPN4_9BACL|nr:type II secretion system F family protein [Paenibacillus mucilaginosus]AFC33390.1 type II secretion system protein [Paenibacillus mucilaginosus 3016]AFH65700.1 type II secretion system protein F [Paenibacillus mucilaginosus K02]WFA21800.1 type II secretion system F family protein [Paenibacillus mucilaginosus]